MDWIYLLETTMNRLDELASDIFEGTPHGKELKELAANLSAVLDEVSG